MQAKHFKLMLIVVSILFYTLVEAQIDTQEPIDSVATKQLVIESPEEDLDYEDPELTPQSEEDLDYEDPQLAPQPEEDLDYEDPELTPQLEEDLDYEDPELIPQPEEDLDYEDPELTPQPEEDLDYEDPQLIPQPEEDLDYEDLELPPVSEKDLDNKDMINISYAVNLLESKMKEGSLPACIAMIISWREEIKVSPMEIVEGVGKWKERYRTNEHEIFDHWKLTKITKLQSYPINSFATFLDNGPLIVILYDEENNKIYGNVVFGLQGNGTPQGTSVTFYEVRKGIGTKRNITYQEFDDNRQVLIQKVKKWKKDKDPNWTKGEHIFIAY